MQVPRFYEASDVARCLGVKWNEVTRWANAPTANFPLPVAVLGPEGNRPLWNSGQIPALRAWFAARLGLSNAEARWSLIDSGEEHPGGHEDQMEMFPVGKEVASAERPDGLFAVESGIA